MCTVLTLKKNILRFQLSQFMWSIVTICLVVYQVKYFAQISLNGLFWYFFPMATVVMNDVSAYFCGITFGRRFIKSTFLTLSPNKTWEGFIGAAILTLIFSWYFPLLLSRWQWLTCPAETLSFWRPKPLTCQINPVFEMKSYTALPLLGDIEILPIQLHGLLYGLFASLVAPFGGFFASAIKRAYEKKDFDSFIAGHGGLMDRMDCQLLMLAFTAFHYKHFIEITPSLKKMMGIFKLMPETEQLKFLNEIQKILN
jgi:phosphatidate cytidylyltransferase